MFMGRPTRLQDLVYTNQSYTLQSLQNPFASRALMGVKLDNR